MIRWIKGFVRGHFEGAILGLILAGVFLMAKKKKKLRNENLFWTRNAMRKTPARIRPRIAPSKWPRTNPLIHRIIY